MPRLPRLNVSTTAIWGIHLLKTSLGVQNALRDGVLLQRTVHLGFRTAGVLLAWMARLVDKAY